MKIKRIPFQKATDERVNYWTAKTGSRFHKEIDNTAYARLLELRDSGGIGSLLWCYDENGRHGEKYKWHEFDRLKTTYVIAQQIINPKEADRILDLAIDSKVDLTRRWVAEFRKNTENGLYQVSNVRTGDLGLRTDMPDPETGFGHESYAGAYGIVANDNPAFKRTDRLDGLTMTSIEYNDEDGKRTTLDYISAPETWTPKERKLREFVERMEAIPCKTFLMGLPRY